MLEIRPVYTSYEREEYTRPFGIVPQDDHTVIAEHNGGRFVGMAYMCFDGENGEIKFMGLIDGYDDYVDRFLLGKAALNHLDLKGVKNVTYTGLDEKLAKALGFNIDNGVMTVCLENYFTGSHEGCHGHCKEEA